MNHLLAIMFSLSLGGAAWGMLVVSDWLLRDKPEGPSKRVNLELLSGSNKRCGRSARAKQVMGTSLRIISHDNFTKGHRQVG